MGRALTFMDLGLPLVDRGKKLLASWHLERRVTSEENSVWV